MENRTFVCKFEHSSPTCAAPAYWYTSDWDVPEPTTGWYFLYGPLMDTTQLAQVLSTEEELILRPARVTGYKVMLWGRYPALLEGTPGSVVRGAAFRVETATQAKKLQGYNTDAYRVQACLIYFEDDGEKVSGYTPLWDGRLDELKEGQFDLRDWQQINQRKVMEEGC